MVIKLDNRKFLYTTPLFPDQIFSWHDCWRAIW